MVARVARHFTMTFEIPLVDGKHHLHHLARGLFWLFVVLIKCASHMTVFALNAKRGGDELHGRNELVRRDPLQYLDILESLIGRLSRRRAGSALSKGEERTQCNRSRQPSGQCRHGFVIHKDFRPWISSKCIKKVHCLRLTGKPGTELCTTTERLTSSWWLSTSKRRRQRRRSTALP